MQYPNLFSRRIYIKAGIATALLLVMLPGLNNFGFSSVGDEMAHVQRAIQLAHERELMGPDAIRLTASGIRRRNDNIQEFVSQYTARALKVSWKGQTDRISRAIIDASVRHGLDPLLLLALIQNESRFDPIIVGTHGEIGLMQIKPDTAEWIAKKSRIHWTGAEMLRDPVSNIRIGAAYLSMLRSKFGFEKNLYLAAYNMGARNLNRLLSSNGYPRIYPQKTIQHYSRIYLEFVDSHKDKPATAALAAI
jgi:soluble lytic murein transglycosylase